MVAHGPELVHRQDAVQSMAGEEDGDHQQHREHERQGGQQRGGREARAPLFPPLPPPPHQRGQPRGEVGRVRPEQVDGQVVEDDARGLRDHQNHGQHGEPAVNEPGDQGVEDIDREDRQVPRRHRDAAEEPDVPADRDQTALEPEEARLLHRADQPFRLGRWTLVAGLLPVQQGERNAVDERQDPVEHVEVEARDHPHQHIAVPVSHEPPGVRADRDEEGEQAEAADPVPLHEQGRSPHPRELGVHLTEAPRDEIAPIRARCSGAREPAPCRRFHALHPVRMWHPLIDETVGCTARAKRADRLYFEQ